jgi:2-dehydro-3-deoxyphosphooctonate aldolase (KDO 8-P synthase)
MEEGLKLLALIGRESGLPLLTDIHESCQASPVAEVVDILQIPAFLCRQTDLLVAAGRTGRIVNIKKGQFASPSAMGHAAKKVSWTGNGKVMLTERGTTFGYGDLVVDMRSIPKMKALGHPVVFDATHSVQKPSGLGDRSGGEPDMIRTLTLSAVAAGASGLFVETHPEPAKALSDGPNSLPLASLESLLKSALRVFEATRS